MSYMIKQDLGKSLFEFPKNLEVEKGVSTNYERALGGDRKRQNNKSKEFYIDFDSQGYCLPAKHVLHTVGPIVKKGGDENPEQLASCYRYYPLVDDI
jgi:hypothetical protein